MNIDQQGIYTGPLDDGSADFRVSLDAVLARIAPLTVAVAGLSSQERVERLCAAANEAIDALDTVTGMADPLLLAGLIEHLGNIAVTDDNVEVQMGVAGDLCVDRRHRLDVSEVIASIARISPAARPAVLHEAVRTMQQLLSLLLLHGWGEGMSGDPIARQDARRAIVETVQGRRVPAAEAAAPPVPVRATSPSPPRGLFHGMRRLTR